MRSCQIRAMRNKVWERAAGCRGAIMSFHTIVGVVEHPQRADQSAVIGINLTKWRWIFRRGEGGGLILRLMPIVLSNLI